ncbi:MAG TPA: putative pyridoxal-dependent aspartate 1-decarboxylase, partial [Marinobacter hydrocarbonoclasticus]|nr:putative pyridoxal-dependent aspartate 1-decarboxylase [Marinobacter nauticus]
HEEGLFRALKYYGHEGAAIVVSKRGHYSLRKAADVLGLGRDALVPVETDEFNRIQTDALRDKCLELQKQKIKIMAICGVAGTTETGNVDPLDAMADIAREFGAHFHVDAAWGGPTLFSRTHRHLLRGIEKADSVTFDAHKQLYVPMGAGLVVFKDPSLASAVEHHAQYIIRKGSRDLGSTTLEGSRPGMSMLIHSGLKILAREGYEILIDQGIEKARTFAEMIDEQPDFELVTRPELNILTYRYCPEDVRQALAMADELQAEKMNTCLNRITKFIQKTQRERGKAFVSRTRLEPARYYHFPCIVFRVVLANPLTTPDILEDILREQRELSKDDGIADEMAILHQMAAAVLKQNQKEARQA